MSAIIVNGLPGSGKTTLARALASALDLPLFSKDSVKETLGNVLGSSTRGIADLPTMWRRDLGRAAVETLWTLMGDSPRGGIVECPILAHQHAAAIEGLRRIGVSHVHEVWCAM